MTRSCKPALGLLVTHAQKNHSVFSPIFSLLLLASENRGTFSKKKKEKRGFVGPKVIGTFHHGCPAAGRSGLEASKTTQLTTLLQKKTRSFRARLLYDLCSATSE